MYACHTHSLSLDFFLNNFKTVSCKCHEVQCSTSFSGKLSSSTPVHLCWSVMFISFDCYSWFSHSIHFGYTAQISFCLLLLFWLFYAFFYHIWHASKSFKFTFKWVLSSFSLHHFEAQMHTVRKWYSDVIMLSVALRSFICTPVSLSLFLSCLSFFLCFFSIHCPTRRGPNRSSRIDI